MLPFLNSPKLPFVVVSILINLLLTFDLKGQVATFLSPDTVCVGNQVYITNQSTPGQTYYWSFCSGNSLSNPLGSNIGNPGNLLNVPSYITLVKDGNICYSFVSSRESLSVVRYNHGTSFSNNPISWTNLVGFGMTNYILGIKICKDNGQWIGFVCNNNSIVRLNFGSSPGNSPAGITLGPYSTLNSAHCIDIINEGGIWVGYLTCQVGNNLVRLNFGNSLLNTPILTDLGTVNGTLNMPTSYRIINEKGIWYALVANDGNNTLTRLTFGTSLFNDPAGVNLGPAIQSTTLGGITLIRDCEGTTGFQLNYSASSPDLIWRLNFPSGITGPVTGTSLGNIGNMNRPAHFSELFRVGDTLFLYTSNRGNNTLTRLRFLPCTNASVPSSSLYNPPPFSYSQPGTYNIQLIVNEGMPNQASLCKSIVVMPKITVSLGNDTIVCEGSPIRLQTGVSAARYRWQDGSTDSIYTVFAPGTFWVTVTKEGCDASDSIRITDCVLPLWFPNAFTPNDDGVNDIFHPVGRGVLSYEILIFDRWGRKVFESTEIEPGWDGRMQGNMCSDGVYVFIATYNMGESSGETYHAKGSITLLR